MVAKSLVAQWQEELDAGVERAAPFLEPREIFKSYSSNLVKLMQRYDEEVEARFTALEEEVRTKIRGSQKEGEGINKKDRKRSEPKDAFTGSNHIDWEWRLVNHMETCFG